MHTDASMFVFGNTLYCYAQMKKVETQNLASHKQECAIYWGDYVPVITAVFARETQGMHLSPAYHCTRFIAMDCSWDARMGYKQMRLYSWYCRVFCSWDARFCVSTRLTPSHFIKNRLRPAIWEQAPIALAGTVCTKTRKSYCCGFVPKFILNLNSATL